MHNANPHVSRILLADDHVLMLEGLIRLLSGEFEVVGAVENGRAMLAEAERLRPDIVVLDVGMPDMNGIEAARRLMRLLPNVKIVFVTQQLDHAYIHAAFNAGGRAYVAKQSAVKELVTAIQSVLRGSFYVTPLAGLEKQNAALDSKLNPAELFGRRLTPRQREVLQLVAGGKSTKQISSILNISVKTVEFHRSALMQELGVHTAAELIRYAILQGIVTQ